MKRFVRFRWEDGTYWGTHEGENVRRWSGAFYLDGQPTETTYPTADVSWLPPVAPSKIICVGLNYAEHVKESASADSIPDEPVIFSKPPTALLAPEAAIVLPIGVDRVDYEGELGAVIGRTLRRASASEAEDAICGWTIVNDVTARNLQKKDKQWTRAKGFDTFCPVGPWVQDEFDWRGSALRTTQNGELRQQSNFTHMIVGVPELIAFMSQVMTLLPGDLIVTGTPAGIGPVSAGDVVAITVDGLGTLTNTVAAES